MRSTFYVEWTAEEITKHTNERFDQLISELIKDNVITEEQANKIGEYRCITVGRNLFGKIFSFLKDKKESSFAFLIKRII